MDLCRTQVGFPVFRFAVRIKYTTSRSITAFERVLLNMADRFVANERYRAIPLERIFEDVLGVSDPLPFIETSLEELVRLDLVKCESGLHAVGKLTLGSLTLTDHGVRMLTAGGEGAVSQRQQETFEYDPIRRKLLSGTTAGDQSARRPAIAIDAAVFQDAFPSELILQTIQNSDYRWWTPQSKVESVERVSADVAWMEYPVAVVSKHGNLVLSCDDPDHTSYLNSLPEKQRLDSIVRPAFFDDRLSDARLKRLPPGDPDKSISGEWGSISQVLSEFPQGSAVWFVNTRLDLLDLPESAPKRCVLLCFGGLDDESAVTVVWNNSGDGCFVFLGQDFPVPEAWLIRGDQVFAARRVNLNLGQSGFETPVVHRYVTDGACLQIRESLTRVTELIAAGDAAEDMLAAAFWLPVRDYWSRHSRNFRDTSSSLADLVQQMRSARDDYLRVTGSADQGPWEESLAAAVSAEAVEYRQLPAEKFAALLAMLASCEITSPFAIESIIDSLAMCLPPLREPSEFSRVCASIRRTGRDWNIPFPSRLYSEEFIAEVIHRFDSEDVRVCMVNENDFDWTMTELASTYHSVMDQLGPETIKLLESSANPSSTALDAAALEKLIDVAQTWSEHFASLGSVCPSLSRYLAGSRLATANRVISGIIHNSLALLPGLDPRFRSVYVFDTSALLARPGLLEAIRPDEYVVVAKRVLEELDDKKMDENLRPGVAKVTKALMDFPEDRIEFCQGDMSLLPKDYRIKGDNLILSVAVRYRQAGATLVTNDRNLSLKAREEGIAVMSADRFAARGNARSGPDESEREPRATRTQRTARREK